MNPNENLVARIDSTHLDTIKRANDLTAVVREQGIALTRRGRTYFGLCPFHAQQTASFAVSRDTGLFHCFGCGAGGDVIRFVERMQQVSFPEAVRRLARRAGVTLDGDAGSDGR